MAVASTATLAPQSESSGKQQLLFWGCFLALITTAFGFVTRMFLEDEFRKAFSLDDAKVGELLGIGIWPFAVSIIAFSLVIDRIGYKIAMVIAFAGHLIWAVMGYMAYKSTLAGDPKTGYNLVYWGSLILGLANGTVEAFINPVVATLFSRQKTKWLNILHAGWPGGLVVAGIITIYMGDLPWGHKLGIIAFPAVIYFLMLIGLRFPVQERVASGVTYREMLAEFGILGALVVAFLVTLQLIQFFEGNIKEMPALRWVFIGIGIAIVVGFGAYTRAAGRPLMFFLILIMMPLATTEIGTDGWITGIMAGNVSFHPGWILVFTSVIMMVLRFFAGPIIHSLSPLGLLAISAVLAIGGLVFLSVSTGVALIFIAATLYAFGKTFFWPTMLGVVAEQMPKGGAMTLNGISGIGMLAVGVLGFPYIGTLKAAKNIDAISAAEDSKKFPGLVADGKLTVLEDSTIYDIIKYKAINEGHYSQFLTASYLFPDLAAQYDAAENVKKYDKNKDGTLDAEETKAMVWAGEKEYDENNDGKLDDAERKAMAEDAVKKAERGKKKAEDAAKSWALRWHKAPPGTKETDPKLTVEEQATMVADEAARKSGWVANFDGDKDGGLSLAEYTKAREVGASLGKVRDQSTQKALMNMAIFPGIMLIGYLLLIAYFKSKGGYQAVHLADETIAAGAKGPDEY